jgi:hypothetical protein
MRSEIQANFTVENLKESYCLGDFDAYSTIFKKNTHTHTHTQAVRGWIRVN